MERIEVQVKTTNNDLIWAPIATETTLGVVKPKLNGGVSINDDGEISVNKGDVDIYIEDVEGLEEELDSINSTLATKSSVAVSGVGTSTNSIKYITVNGVEYKIEPETYISVTSVNGETGDVELYATNLALSSEDSKNVKDQLDSLRDEVGIRLIDVTLNGVSIVGDDNEAVIPMASLGKDTETDALATVNDIRSFVNSSIQNVAARYLTNSNDQPFATKAALTAAGTVFHYAGQVTTPTANDYALVTADETQSNKTTRYTYQGGVWTFQYVINNEPLTTSQLNALNSGITSSKVTAHDNAANKLANYAPSSISITAVVVEEKG